MKKTIYTSGELPDELLEKARTATEDLCEVYEKLIERFGIVVANMAIAQSYVRFLATFSKRGTVDQSLQSAIDYFTMQKKNAKRTQD